MAAVAIRERVARYYADKIRTHGPVSQGVDWNSAESQLLRFRQLLRVCEPAAAFSINDYGCGYGALVDHLAAGPWRFEYRGFDIEPRMLEEARRLHRGRADCAFFDEESLLPPADYTVASGVFNVKLDVPVEAWQEYVMATLDVLGAKSRGGFAFNLLTSHSDPDRRRSDLYYADPAHILDHCLRRYGRHVALLHDYRLFEFTVLVRR
jgi:SAM-dependent methyltransferase